VGSYMACEVGGAWESCFAVLECGGTFVPNSIPFLGCGVDG
jgi:hypothetical protein